MQTILSFLSIIFIITTIVFLFIKGKRRYSLMSAALTIVALIYLGNLSNKEAVEQGFLSAQDQTNAIESGITDPTEWTDEKRMAFKQKKEAEKQEALINSRKKHNCDDTIMAFIKSQEFVKRHLKSPSTASFPSKASSIKKAGECSFSVNAYVDAQNSFGAMLRSQYNVTITYYPEEDTWRGSNLNM